MTQTVQGTGKWRGDTRLVAGEPATFYLDPDLHALLEYFGLLTQFFGFAIATAEVRLQELERRPIDKHANSFSELDNDSTEERWKVKLPGEMPARYSFTCFAGQIENRNGAIPDDIGRGSHWIIRPVSMGRGHDNYQRPACHAAKRTPRGSGEIELSDGEIIPFLFHPDDQKAMGGGQHNRWKALLTEACRQFRIARDRLHVGPRGTGVASVELVFPLPEEAKRGISVSCPKEWTVEVFLVDLRGKSEVRYNLRSGNHVVKTEEVTA